MVNVTPTAISDITEYYLNVMRKYPNTWDYSDVYSQVDFIIEKIEYRANYVISLISKTNSISLNPLLVQLQTNDMVELSIDSPSWSFTLRHDENNGEYYIDNAVKSGNNSNRARRRGCANPVAPLSIDDRRFQLKKPIREKIHISESQLRRIIRESLIKTLYS